MTQPKRFKSLRWLAFVLLGMVLFCGGSSFLALLVSKNSSERRLQKKLEQLAAKGIPVDDASVAELHKTLTSKENINVWIGILDKLATKHYSELFQNMPIVGESIKPIPKIGEPWADEPVVKQVLSQNADTLKQLLDVAQDNGPVWYPIDFNSFNTRLPYAESTQIAARLLLLEAIVAARAGDADREFRAINAMIGCALSVRGEPCLVSQHVSISVHALALDRLRPAVQANRLSAEQLGILRTRLAPFSDIKVPYTANLQGQIAVAIPAFRDPVGANAQFKGVKKLIVSSGAVDRAACKYIERMEEALEISTDNLQNFVADCQAWESPSSSGGMLQQMEDSIAERFIPALLSNIGNALVRSKMLNDLATLAIAARQYEMANGQLPKSLEELTTQGIDLSLFHCVDGNLPNYLLVDKSSQISPSADSADSARSSEASRAILWSVYNQNANNRSNPLQEKTDPKQWRWDLQ